MRQIKLIGTIGSDHKLSADMPSDVPAGPAEIIVLVRDRPVIGRSKSLSEFITRLHKADIPRRSKEEIDRCIEQERDSWEWDDSRDLPR